MASLSSIVISSFWAYKFLMYYSNPFLILKALAFLLKGISAIILGGLLFYIVLKTFSFVLVSNSLFKIISFSNLVSYEASLFYFNYSIWFFLSNFVCSFLLIFLVTVVTASILNLLLFLLAPLKGLFFYL